MSHLRFRYASALCTAFCAVFLVFIGIETALPASASAAENKWPDLKQNLFGNTQIKSDGDVDLQVPDKVADAALVPITVVVPPNVTQPIKSMVIIIDNNPMPMVARFTFGPAEGTGGERRMSTRVRVDNFSYIRAIVETADGKYHMATKFIAAAGGCAAMNATDPTLAQKGMGKMIVKTFAPALSETPIWKGLVMLRHPNNSGLQIDPNTGKFIPARFIDKMEVMRGGQLVFRMTGGSAISANPYFRFTFGRGKNNTLSVKMIDTKNTVFTGHSEPNGS